MTSRAEAAAAIAPSPLRSGPWNAVVDGHSAPAASGETFEVTDPATGAPLARVAACGAEDVDAAVRSARRAYEERWRGTSRAERSALLERIARAIDTHRDELAELESRDVGKPIQQSRDFDVPFAIACFERFARLADTLDDETIEQGPITATVVREPYGVVGAIIPFNWPPVHTAGKVAPALAAGNTIVVKPPEQAPLVVLRLVELMQEVLPPGVVNAVPGVGPVAGSALASHPLVGHLSFTGSSATGAAVLRAAAPNITPAIMELGGKSAFIVFPDADLDAALGGAIEGMFFNQGEACTAASRLLLHDAITERFLARLRPAVERLRVGHPLDERSDLGPMVTRAQQERVAAYVRIGEEEGARVVARGATPDDPALAGGYWSAPLVFAGVDNGMRIAQEEIFGPVLCVLTFRDEAEAVRIANATDFGLVAAVWTADEDRARRVSAALEAGVVFVNNYFRAFLGSPFGGYKKSGYGREHWRETLHEYTRVKAIRVPNGSGPVPVWRAAREV